MFAKRYEDPPEVWGVSRVVVDGEVTPWPVSQGDIEDEAKSLAPRLPIPSPPTVTRSLGATAPPRPNADAGTISGAAAIAPVPSAALSASRLDRPFPFVAIRTPSGFAIII